MLDKIDPLAAALRNLEQQQSELNTAFKSGQLTLRNMMPTAKNCRRLAEK
jgi:hypothetical protein